MTKVSGPDLNTWFTGFVKQVDNSVERVAEELAEYGQKVMYEMIETRGTGKTWSRSYNGRRASRPGRVATGQMRADIEQFSGRMGKTIAVASAGWLYHFEDYYRLQEEGFTHPITGDVIKGMNIMADAADLMIKKAEQLLDVKFRAL